MSDEMLNNSEETAALFVAKQKKKEEEKKAAEEQAERDLKEAEVARMEAEIEQRKKKATQKKIIAVAVTAAVVVITLIILINVISAVSDIGKMDYASLDFNSEYAVKSSENQVKIKYPGELYKDVTETKLDENEIRLDLVPEKEGLVTSKMAVIYNTSDNKSRKLSRAIIAVTEPKELNDLLQRTVEGHLKDMVPGAVVSDVEVSDYTAENAGKYHYTASFKGSEYSGAVAGWFEFSDDGVLQTIIVSCMAPGEYPTDGITMRDNFFAQNSDDALQLPGMNPPQSTALDGTIEYPECGLSMKAPKDRFYPDEKSNYISFGDINGALITVFPQEFEQGFENTKFDLDTLMNNYMERSKVALGAMLNGVSNKEQMSPEYTSETGSDFSLSYSYEWGGRKYFELYFVTPWSSDNGKDYFVEMELLCPYENMNEYVDIYDEMIVDFMGIE